MFATAVHHYNVAAAAAAADMFLARVATRLSRSTLLLPKLSTRPVTDLHGTHMFCRPATAMMIDLIEAM